MWIETGILLLPLVVGGIQAFIKHEVVDDATEDLVEWLDLKSRKMCTGPAQFSRAARWTVAPVCSLFTTIHALTENIGDYGLRSAVRATAYLYLLVFLFMFLITFGYKVILLAAAGLGLFFLLSAIIRGLDARKAVRSAGTSGEFVAHIWPFFRSDSTRGKVAELFEVPSIDVDYTGNVTADVSAQGPGKTAIGRVDQHGHIYDTRTDSAERIGRIDPQGRVLGGKIIN